MKKIISLVVLATVMTGCIIAPAQPYYGAYGYNGAYYVQQPVIVGNYYPRPCCYR